MYNQLLLPKWRYLTTVSLMTFLLSAAYLNLNYNPNSANGALSTITRLTSIFLMTLLGYSDKVTKKAKVYLLGIMIDLITEIISCSLPWAICHSKLPYPFPVEMAPEVVSMGKVICLDVLSITTLTVLIFIKKKDITSKYSQRRLIIMLLFCTIHFFFLVINYTVYRSPDFEINDWLHMIFQLMLFSIIIFDYFSTLRISELERKESRIKIINAEIERDREYFELADSKFEEISRIRHDMQNQIATIKLLMQTENGRKEAEDIINGISYRLDQI